ncbi:MAG: hypothetical protein CV090_16575 [Nitrospira sp. WS238]|nr:hypothetical protein [Nitrospira sp. WS238]
MMKACLIGCGIFFVGTLWLPGGESRAQSWDYDSYQGNYDGLYGYDWYYDYYFSPSMRPGRYGSRQPMQNGDGKSDRELKEDVEWELTASPFVDDDDIQVSVKNGTVTLRGTVENKSSVQDAIENAREAGAKEVINRLETEEDS